MSLILAALVSMTKIQIAVKTFHLKKFVSLPTEGSLNVLFFAGEKYSILFVANAVSNLFVLYQFENKSVFIS